MKNTQIAQNTGTGYLKVRVTAADNALPIGGASVTVTKRNGSTPELINKQTTNDSGQTEQISLPAPPKELSQSPGNPTPYANYNIRVDYTGYYSVEHIDVPIFDGQLSIQPTQLVPLPLDTLNGMTTTIVEHQIEL